MKVLVTKEERRLLETWLNEMCNENLTISQRRVARIRYHHLLNVGKQRALDTQELDERKTDLAMV
ncbi:hypothetical protein EVS87_012045 [Bacillus altitudinis]|uniref:hypothetical protein n=1 Tax=Bacillus TaxID=1386 RepID=UPI0010722B5E|nr:MULTISPECIES: hypothetical protein [Bacillus]MBR0581185.1 hypothetical protein [Bacillus altitudinis A23-8]MBW3700536.1 hypothetical protein [Bacillus aerophilus]QEO62922.1 hypothetical protein EVS87_012045 [Bacillus altitudinis]QLI78714.1 hypothetical protein HZ310_13165 [Bacillus pumilus]